MTALATPPRATPTLAPPVAEQFETVACYLCGGTESFALHHGRGRPHRQAGALHVRHVRAMRAAISEPAAHRRAHQVVLRRRVHRAPKEEGLGRRSPASSTGRWTGTIGRRTRSSADSCGSTSGATCSTSAARSGRSSRRCARATARGRPGVDFKDLSASPTLAGVDFRCGLFYEQDFGDKRFDLDHDVAFSRARLRSDAHARRPRAIC